MYVKLNRPWFLASPSAYDNDRVALVWGEYFRMNDGICDYPNGICPLVSLKSGVLPEINN